MKDIDQVKTLLQKEVNTIPASLFCGDKGMNEYNYKLIILGDPKAQGRHRTYTKGKGGRLLPYPIQVDPSAKDKSNLRAIVQDQAPEKLLDCPLRVDLYFYMPRPKGHYGTGKNAEKLKSSSPINHTKRPDIDNLRKLVMDALTNVFWRDDSLVCEGLTRKIYSDNPRTEIYIKVLGKDK